ncbi:uncharacterized protein K452DRAFT_292961 [Aplosporella prunicola CBS 121167]|uniref:HhH-GPD domain-containing protein n=1 Tax=Aplosporella prunicola CBS 121167 TaxID=1176127 RepID=A0A6A6AVP8_9PEZI|nr:uncharacterized protein K452DRAFT_292961 [Aplosporella prunicola CBS 121167]KAF2135770.1 hypothetical protein K452DRAFT_292961 [Aplosporella prunicola CBS 121167]
MSARVTRSASSRQTPKAIKSEQLSSSPATPATGKGSRKRTREPTKKEEDINDLPHNLGRIPSASVESPETEQPASKKARARAPKKASKPDLEKALKDAAPMVAKVAATDEEGAKSAKKKKNLDYGLTPGSTPYPEWPHPTPEECQEVVRLLSSIHGEVQVPKSVPPPSLDVSGCGEVPSVLDALIRTRLSAATTGANSSRAFRGLVDRFGIIEEGIGKGSVNWDSVRRADTKEIFQAIKSGGLADVKSKDIKSILQMVHRENQDRHETLTKESAAAPAGAENESAAEKEAEIARAESNVLSLDHLHAVPSEDAFNHLIKYPGIGPKTASCVLLFCLQRPSFAVDTHVFRLCKYLQWVPPDKATRNSTYAHCEVRIPDELKYPLHALLIRHGKSCPRCRAATGLGSEGWARGCVIEHLVTRGGVRKGGVAEGKGKVKAKARKRGKISDEETGEEDGSDSELSNLVSDEGEEE